MIQIGSINSWNDLNVFFIDDPNTIYIATVNI